MIFGSYLRQIIKVVPDTEIFLGDTEIVSRLVDTSKVSLV